MRLRSIITASLAAVLVLAVSITPAAADVFYVDASLANTDILGGGADSLWASGDDGSTGGTVADGDLSAVDNLWAFRESQGSNGLFEARANSPREDAPEIVTTATGLANDTYDVYVFYRSNSTGGDNWKIRAGLTSLGPNSNQIYDRTGDDGIEGIRALSGGDALTFATGTEPDEDSGQPLLYAKIGQANVTTGSLSVFIDDFPASDTGASQDRSWYDGIGYELFIPPVIVKSIASGPAASGLTWDNAAPAAAGADYQVLNSHTVTVSGDFPGDALEVQSGGTVNVTQSGVDFRDLTVRSGGDLTLNIAGDFALGNIFAPTLGKLTVEQDLTYNLGSGSDFYLDMTLDGPGNLNFGGGGAGSELYLTAAGSHDGVIRFGGSSDTVKLTESESFHSLEMNSTGANRVSFEGRAATGGGTLIFNQPGIIDHASIQVDPPSTAPRLQSVNELEVNADVTVDLTKSFNGNERRFLVSQDLRGAGNLTINGTATNPTSGDVTHNEFEVGATGQPNTATTDTYSGTVTGNDYVDFEIRHNQPNARFVINSHARLEMGWQAIDPNQSVSLGEVQINSGGTLEVGFEQDGQHNVRQLELTSSGDRDGSLTLASGSTTVMQVNGTADNEFDSIVADGDVALGGTLHLLVNPDGSGGTNPTYTPTLGDTFDIILIASGGLPTDFDGSGTVDGQDLDAWQAAYGVDASADANGDEISDGADFLAWQRDLGNPGAPDGTITGTFALSVDDPNNVLGNAGLAFKVNYSSTLVQLEVVAAGAISAVPEPTSAMLLLGGVVGLLGRRNRRKVRNV